MNSQFRGVLSAEHRIVLVPLVLVLLTLMFVSGCGVAVRSAHKVITNVKTSPVFHQGRFGPLTEKEQGWAQIAWGYFERNYNPEFGLINSVDQYPTTTMWNLGDYLAALTAAYELDLIDYHTFDSRFSKLLEFLNNMDLFLGRVPNKAYHTQSGKMVNFENNPAQEGWSSIDIGRLLIWLMITRSRYPEFSEFIDRAVMRWNFCDLIDDCGTMYGGAMVDGKKQPYQEGRLGYEEYAAYGYQLMGLDTSRASSISPFANVNLFGIQIPYDSRDWRESGAFAPILSGPYLLHGMEFNWDLVDDPSTRTATHSNTEIADIADKIYRVQQARYDKERLLTARTDHQLNKPPYFLFDSIYAAGYPWSTLSYDGTYHRELALIATKAVFGMWVLWDTPYTDRLMKVTESLVAEKKGWLEGRYELSGGWEEVVTASTNSAVLEALLYKVQGKIYRVPEEPTFGLILMQGKFKHQNKCLPPLRKLCPVGDVHESAKVKQ